MRKTLVRRKELLAIWEPLSPRELANSQDAFLLEGTMSGRMMNESL